MKQCLFVLLVGVFFAPSVHSKSALDYFIVDKAQGDFSEKSIHTSSPEVLMQGLLNIYSLKYFLTEFVDLSYSQKVEVVYNFLKSQKTPDLPEFSDLFPDDESLVGYNPLSANKDAVSRRAKFERLVYFTRANIGFENPLAGLDFYTARDVEVALMMFFRFLQKRENYAIVRGQHFTIEIDGARLVNKDDYLRELQLELLSRHVGSGFSLEGVETQSTMAVLLDGLVRAVISYDSVQVH